MTTTIVPFPSGRLDLGESLPDAAVRETLEETGVSVEITGLVGIYTDPKHIILYTSNNEARQELGPAPARPRAGPGRVAGPALRHR